MRETRKVLAFLLALLVVLNTVTPFAYAETGSIGESQEEVIEGIDQQQKDETDVDSTRRHDLEKELPQLPDDRSGGPVIKRIISPVVNTYTYIFMVDAEEWERQIVQNGEFLIEPEAPEKENLRFIGWFTESDIPGEPDIQIDFDQPVSVAEVEPPENTDIEVYAKFDELLYNVTFVYGNKILKTKEVSPGGTVDDSGVPLNVTEEGKVFSHWSETPDGSAFDFNTPIHEDKSLYAVTKDAWIVTFDSKGGSAILPKHIEDGNELGTPESPTRAGYVFKHWSLTDGGPAIPANYVVTENITLYAVWEAGTNTCYKVIYWQENAEDDGYTFEEQDIRTGTTGAPATYESKSYTGFHFSHADDTTISANGDTVVNVYYKRNVHTFTIEYRTGSGSLFNPYVWHTYSTTPLKYGQSTATQYNAAVAAYPYYGWYISRTSSTSYSKAPAMPDNNLTVHGRHSGSAYQYTIGYYESGTNIEIKEPYSFYSGSGSLSFTDEDGIDIPGFTVTPRNQWDRLRPNQVSKIYYTRNNYTLTFNKNNGETPLVIQNIPFESDISDKDTTGLSAGSTYVEDGITYYFDGWYDNVACTGQPYTLGTMPAHNLALYAKWTPEKYKVTFYNTLNEEDGVFHTEENITPLHTISQPAGNPPGTDFKGWYWYLDGHFVQFDFGTPISGNFKLYPIFGTQTAQVTYDANGGDGAPVDNNNYLIGAEAVVKSAPATAPANKVFLSWNTAADGTGTTYMPNSVITVPTGGVTLYAQWGDINTGTFITYNANGGTGGPTTIDLANNATHTIIANSFTRPGYDFTGWNSEADGSGNAFSVGDKVTVDRINQETENILYAQWERTTTDVVATKNWVGGHAVNHTRVVIDLYRTPEGGTEEKVTQEPVVTPSSGTHDTFTHTWEDLPTHTEQGDLYTYRVEEPTVHSSYTAVVTGGGYAFTVTNTYHNAKEVEAKKYWRGISGTSDKVAVWFTLYRTTTTGTDEKVPGLDPEKIPPGNDSAHWNNLLGEDAEGNAYTFYVKETDKYGNDWVPDGFEKVESGLSVYNYKLTQEQVIGTKKWVGGLTPRPQVIFELWRTVGEIEDGVKVTDPVIVENDQANFGYQRLTDENDLPYTYYVVETGIPENYVVSYNYIDEPLTATNTYNYTSLVTLTAPSASKTYDGTPLTATTGVIATGLPEGFTVEATVSGSQTNVGSSDNEIVSYVIKDSNDEDQTEYFKNVTTVDGSLEITKRQVTLTSATDSKVYDGEALTNDTVTVTGDGWAAGEGATYDVTGSQTNVGASDNEFTYTLDEGTLAANYDITQKEGTLTVTAVTDEVIVTITENSGTELYDGEEKTVTGYTVTSISNPLYTEDDFSFSGDASVSGTNAGTYDMELKPEDFTNDNANFTNVTFVIVDGTLEITKRQVTLTSADDSKVYDGTALTNDTVTVGGDGWADGEGATYEVTGSQTDVGESSNTFDYTLDEGTLAANYDITQKEGTLTVTAVTDEVIVTITENSGTELYDGTEKTVTGYTVTSISNPLYTEDDFSFSGDASVSGTNAGTYDMELKPEDFTNTNANFTNVTFVIVDGTLEITKRQVTLTSADDSKVYDGTALTNDTVTVGGDGWADGEGATYEVTGSQTDVGESANTFDYTLDEGTLAANYDITQKEGTLTVSTLDDEIIVTITENSGTELYDGTEKTVTGYTVTSISNPLYTEDDFSFSGDASVSGTNAGTYDMELKPEDFTNDNANFTNVTFVIVDGTLKITKRQVTLTSADDSKVYDGTALTNDTVTVGGDGWAPGEGATYEVTGSQTDVGESSNTFDYTLDEGTLAANYDITQKEGTLTVSTLDDEIIVTITENSGTELYDGTEKTVTGYTVTSISNPLYTEDDFSFSGDASVSGTNAGTYDMELKPEDFTNTNANFTNVKFVIVDGSLEITKRQVTLTSATDSKVYDGTALTNDTVTVTGDGWADGEGATYEVTGSQTDVGESSNTFTYALNEGTLEDNYDITVVKGQLTVTKPLIPTPTELQITGLKKLAGRTLKEGEFTFIVRNEADPDSMIDSDTNDEHGNFQLDILFKKEGTYKLVIEELKGSLPNVIYDSNSYLLTVEVEEDNNGVLHIVDSNLADLDVIFNNTYDPPTLPETGERGFNLFLYGGLSLIGSGLLLVRKKRKLAR